MLENWVRPAFRSCLVGVIVLSTIVFTTACSSGTGPKKLTGIATGSAGGGTGAGGSSIGSSGKGSTGTGSTVVFIGMASAMNLSGKISGFSFTSNGSSQLISGSPITGGASTDLLIDASERFLFGSDLGDVTTYAIQTGGVLTRVNNLTGTFGPQLDRADNTLYALQVMNGTASNAIANLQITSTGALSSTGSLQVSKGSGRLYFTPDELRAYEPFCPGSGANILGYVRGSNGILTPFVTNAVLPTDSLGSPACPQAIAISPDGLFLVAGFNAPGNKAIGLVIYAINPGGTLSLISGPFPTTAPSRFAVFDPSGKFIAIAESDGVAVYQFNGISTPVLLSGTPIGGAGTEFVRFNRAGNLIFATSLGAAQLDVFTFNSGIVLVAPGAPISPGFAPATLVVVN